MPTFTIGREINCDVPIADDSVSRVHAEIWLSPDGVLMLADRGSSNGTTVIRNGLAFPLKEDTVLPSDEVRIGRVTLKVSELVAAVESRHPGALTPAARGVPAPPNPPKAVPTPPPVAPMPPPPVAARPPQPPAPQPVPPPPPPQPPRPPQAPQAQPEVPPRPPAPPPGPPPVPDTSPARAATPPPPPQPPPQPAAPQPPHPPKPPRPPMAAQELVLCTCGKWKVAGQACPSCMR